MVRKLSLQKMGKGFLIVMITLMGIWLTYFVTEGYLFPSEHILSSAQNGFSKEEMDKLNALFQQENIRYWVGTGDYIHGGDVVGTYHSVAVTWAQQPKAVELLEKGGWDSQGIMSERNFLPRWSPILWDDWKFILNPAN